MVSCLNRNEAIAFLRLIQCCCDNLNPEKISLDESNINEDSVGYRVVIDGAIDDRTMELVKLSANNHALEVKEEKNRLIIYNQIS